MNDLAVLPTPSKVFRSLLTATGYRPCLEGKGFGRDLDHLALEERSGSNFDLLENCQAQWLRTIRDDAGADWSNLAESAWNRHSNLLRSLARKADTTGMIQDRARPAIFRMLVIPEISGFVRRVHQELPLLDIRQWWDSPCHLAYRCTTTKLTFCTKIVRAACQSRRSGRAHAGALAAG
ncbi:hypothetical protein N5K55_05255 [Pseudomonas aeruginosa]|nr:hypothetical protein [Pseudomonas aeruginosa]